MKRNAFFLPFFFLLVFLLMAFDFKKNSHLISILQPYNIEGISNSLARFGKENDGGYIVPRFILENSDVVMSYGVANDISFETDLINKFNINVYAFDCGISSAPMKNDKLYFFSECIGTDKTINDDQQSSGIVTTYNQQIRRLKLNKSRVFIKMDIEGGEYYSFYDIDKNLLKNIQGIVIELHRLHNNPDAIKLLKHLNKTFVLIHLHGNNYSNTDKNGFPNVIELTYINIKFAKSKKILKISYPTDLDMPNNPKEKDIIMDFWK